ncbi:MAG TPA: aconitase X catalytic domain-containing protein [Myxococcota bacterium]|nr:aconitase X catalytic domain-containing protein [Myxococcota bacterium]HRY94591.1 aconitase X catalytic domain-containing protein [Myxococcota bacterium]HSA20327.1 aconitase X catalytic domain-containing protein [Myxococcota bacterium]
MSATRLELDDGQRALLAGQAGGWVQRLMRLLVRLGEIYGARRLLPVASVQVSGVSYKSLGEPGLAFLEELSQSGARVRALTSLNPSGVDPERAAELGFPADFVERQARIMAAFARLGVLGSATCTPYQAGLLPRFGQHLAWAESSSVAFANAVLGARTNREGGPSALAAAVCGCTPEHGLHLDQARRPTHRVRVEAELGSTADHGALGVWVGRRVGAGVPYFEALGAAGPGADELKALGAAMAASGAVAMYHVAGVTPEAARHDPAGLPELRVGRAELDQVYAELGPGDGAGEPDLLVTGCPHASLEEIAALSGRLAGKRLRRPLWVCTSAFVREAARRLGLAGPLEAAGGRLVADTCPVVAPIERMGFRCTGVDSGKAACYLPGLCQQRVVFRPLEELLEEALA